MRCQPKRAGFALVAVASCALLGGAAPAPRQRATTSSLPIVRFFTDGFWLNLHHFLYVRAAVADARAHLDDSR